MNCSLERDLEPTSEATRLEGPDGFIEYKGSDKLAGRKVIITGGDSGIGRAVAVQMAREGADLTIVYLPEEQPDAEDTKSMVEQEGRKCLLVPFNLENIKDCSKIIDQHMKKYGKLDVLVNNASKQIINKDFADIDLGMILLFPTPQPLIAHLSARCRSSKFDLPVEHHPNVCHDKIRPAAHEKGCFVRSAPESPHHSMLTSTISIINTTSVVAFRGTPEMVDYAASKGAIVSFTRALAKNLIPKGIRVNAVA